MLIKEVSQQIGANPQTIRQWINKFDLDIEVNSRGHRIFCDDDLEDLSYIKELMAQGETFKSAYNLFYDTGINTDSSTPLQGVAIEDDSYNTNNNQFNDIEVYEEPIDEPELPSTDISSSLLPLLLCNKKAARFMLFVFTLIIVGSIAKPYIENWWAQRKQKTTYSQQVAQYPYSYRAYN